MLKSTVRARSSSGQSIGLRSRRSSSEATPPTRRAYFQARILLGQTPAQARAEQRLIRALAKDAVAGRITQEEALAALVAHR